MIGVFLSKPDGEMIDDAQVELTGLGGCCRDRGNYCGGCVARIRHPDRYDSFNSDVASSPELASHYAKKVLKIEGIDARDAQLLALMRRELNQWEQYFVWHSGGLLSESDWQDWDGYFRLSISNALPQEWWLALRPYYQGTQGEFRAHVDRVYESQ